MLLTKGSVQLNAVKSYAEFCLHWVMVSNNNDDDDMGSVVQSIVSLTSSLRVFSLTVLAASIYNILIFFAEKM